MADIFTNPDFLPQFIELYRKLPCLWRVRSREYLDRSKRQEAYAKLAELVNAVNAKADTQYVKQKISNLRTVYRKQQNKVPSLQRSGAAEDDVHVPRLWYFDSLQFLNDHEEPWQSINTLQLPLTHQSPSSRDPGTGECWHGGNRGAGTRTFYGSIEEGMEEATH